MNLWSVLEDMTNLLTTKGYDQFVIPIKLKMKFTFFGIAQKYFE